MLKQTEGSHAVAEAVALCRPEVICAYPISPQTHIVEGIGEMVKSGELKDCEFINVESEFAAMSVAIGSSATGARTYTATASQGLLFMAYLKVAPRCDVCGEELFHHSADDAPAYFTIVIVGHIIVPSMLIVERLWHPPLAYHFIGWTVLTLALTFAILPGVKGAIVGLQWALRMEGFGAEGSNLTSPED